MNATKRFSDRLARVRARMPLYKVIRQSIRLSNGEPGEVVLFWGSPDQFEKVRTVLGFTGWIVMPVGPFVSAVRVVS